LQSIAQTLWGDGSLWYVLADANGLTAADPLVAGMQLTVPNKVTNVHNNAGTFRPYSPGEAMGDISPSIPAMPKPPKNKGGCGGIGAIIAAVVSIVVTAITMNPILGNIAGQIVGMATGAQKGFNFMSLAMSTVNIGLFSGDGFLAAAGNAAINNMAGQGLDILAGQQKSFNWGAVAASAVGGGVGKVVSNKLNAVLPGITNGQANFANHIVTGVVTNVASGVASQLTQIALNGKGRLDWTSVAMAGISGAGEGYQGYQKSKAEIATQRRVQAAASSDKDLYYANLAYAEANKPIGGMMTTSYSTNGGLMAKNATSASDVGVKFTQDQFESQAEYNNYSVRNGGLITNTVDSSNDAGITFTANQFQQNNNKATIAAYFGTERKDTVKQTAINAYANEVSGMSSLSPKDLMTRAGVYSQGYLQAKNYGDMDTASAYLALAAKATELASQASEKIKGVPPSRIPVETNLSSFSPGWNTGEYAAGLSGLTSNYNPNEKITYSFAAGFHLPVSVGVAAGPQIEYKNGSWTLAMDSTVGTIADIGFSFAAETNLTRPSNYATNIGFGKYLGVQFTTNSQSLPGQAPLNKIGFGLGLSIGSPVNVTISPAPSKSK
jgi:hypothetical protein